MIAGIDFGTSSCSLGIWREGSPRLLALDGTSTRLASVLHVSKRGEGRIEAQTLEQAMAAGHPLAFGEAAIRTQLDDPLLGYFVKSPKSFLGAELKPSQRILFAEIVAKMLTHIRETAEAQAGEPITDVVLGRPVNFHGTRGEQGNAQATEILQGAAMLAGFRNIEFLLEPIAAALDYERSITSDLTVLVLDAGGGTTDCSMVRVGPSYRGRAERSDSVLGNTGTRVGGIDVDIKLAMRRIMPLLGSDDVLDTGLPVPTSIFWAAAAVNDVTAQSEFYSKRTGFQIDQLQKQVRDTTRLRRIEAVYNGRLTYQLNRSAELAKIELSEREESHLDLDYVERGLKGSVSSRGLEVAIERELAVFVALMREAESQAQTSPDVVYVTGGTARSPIIERYIRKHFRDVPLVVGDLFGSVTSGLATWADRVFQKP